MSYEDAVTEAVRAALEWDASEEECRVVVRRRAAQLAHLDADEDASLN